MKNKLAKLKIKSIKWLGLSVLLIAFLCCFSVKAQEGEASLSVYPQSGTFVVRNTFDVSVFLNTGGKNINVVKVELKFDPEKLRVITPAKGLSIVGEWIFPPSFSNSKGIVTLTGGFSSKGINTSEGLVSVVVFEAIAPGRTEVNFLESSKVLVGEEEGADILTSINRGVYEIVPPPSLGPKIYSSTHPDQNKWYKNDSPVFSWEKISKAEGYSYSLDGDPYGEPDNNIDTDSTSAFFEGAGEGTQYFHLKAKKNQAWGGTSHFKVMIDKSVPFEFKPYLASFSLASGNSILVYFNTSDLLSGLDYYETRIADVSDPENTILSAWMRQESPFRIDTKKSGKFNILVRAFDKAGNYREGETQLRVFAPPLVLGTGGIQIKGFFLPWWIIYIILIALLSFAGFKIYSTLRKRNFAKRLRKEIKEAEKEIEDVKKLERSIRKTRVLEEEAKEAAEKLVDKLRGDDVPLKNKQAPEKPTKND